MRILIVYATREGQTRRIAMRLADELRAAGRGVDIQDAGSIGAVAWSKYSTACLAASVHAGHHEPEMVRFVKQHRADLERVAASFVSVTLSEAGAEDPKRSEAERLQAAADVQRMIDDFVKETGWKPAHTLPVAGALNYSKYNFFIRFVMKRIARKQGAPIDTSRDYEFTNWANVAQLAHSLCADGHGHVV
jgi:menaquinone-dependent protoporphyrinogen oxidase